jgi:hypothetical protein
MSLTDDGVAFQAEIGPGGTRRLQAVHISRTRAKPAVLIVISVFSPAPATPPETASVPPGPLGRQERAVLSVLADNAGRVVSRRELARQVGLADLSARRCDSLLVGVRRAIGAESIRTVRSRGWILQPEAIDAAERLLQRS